ncbi:MAG: type II secretion system F family protein [Chthoniobacterales bacterium]|nr:type II secretion system F family protein [Chthoniobacterales bacterium]
MLKKVILSNIYNGRTTEVVVDTDDDDRAVVGAGKAPNETVTVTDITGVDEWVHRLTMKKPTLAESAGFFSGLARCLERNIAINKSIELMAPRLQSPRYRGAVAEISKGILAGEKLSDCFAQHPDLFTEDVLALIQAGEESGHTDAVFKQITSGREKSLRILRKLRAGLIYPVIVIVLALVVILLMSFTLVPSISKLYASMNVQLPLATRIMVAFSDMLIHQPYMAAVPVIALIVFFKNWSKIYAIPQVQIALSRIPSIGMIIKKTAAMVSFRVLALLLQANVRVVLALQIAAKSANHVEFEGFFLAVRDHINDGLSMPESFLMEAHRLGADGRMIAGVLQMAGETGGMNEVLDQIASDYEEELDLIAAQFDKILEPFVLVILGSVVGGIIYAIYGPIFGLSKVIIPDTKHPGKAPPGMSAPAVPGS